MSLRLFFFNDTATTEIYTLSLHDALPICPGRAREDALRRPGRGHARRDRGRAPPLAPSRRADTERRQLRGRSEEHTSELQSRLHLVCRLLLEKKKDQLTNLSQSNTSSVHD